MSFSINVTQDKFFKYCNFWVANASIMSKVYLKQSQQRFSLGLLGLWHFFLFNQSFSGGVPWEWVNTLWNNDLLILEISISYCMPITVSLQTGTSSVTSSNRWTVWIFNIPSKSWLHLEPRSSHDEEEIFGSILD